MLRRWGGLGPARAQLEEILLEEGAEIGCSGQLLEKLVPGGYREGLTQVLCGRRDRPVIIVVRSQPADARP